MLSVTVTVPLEWYRPTGLQAYCTKDYNGTGLQAYCAIYYNGCLKVRSDVESEAVLA